MIPNEWTRGSGQKLNYKKLHLKIKKNTHTHTPSLMRLVKHWNRFPSLEINPPGYTPEQPDLAES